MPGWEHQADLGCSTLEILVNLGHHIFVQPVVMDEAKNKETWKSLREEGVFPKTFLRLENQTSILVRDGKLLP